MKGIKNEPVTATTRAAARSRRRGGGRAGGEGGALSGEGAGVASAMAPAHPTRRRAATPIRWAVAGIWSTGTTRCSSQPVCCNTPRSRARLEAAGET